MLTAPSRPAYHHPTTLPPLPGSQLSLGAPRVDLIAAGPATRVGSDPEPIFREPATQYSLHLKHPPRKQSKSQRRRSERLDRGGEDQKENRHLSAKSLGLLIQRKETYWIRRHSLDQPLSDAGSSPAYTDTVRYPHKCERSAL